jgi:hypothetical protein
LEGGACRWKKPKQPREAGPGRKVPGRGRAVNEARKIPYRRATSAALAALRAPRQSADEGGNFGPDRPQSITKRRFFLVYQKLGADITVIGARWNAIVKLFIS